MGHGYDGAHLVTRLLDGTQSSINGYMSSLTRTETVVYLVILTGCWMRHNEITTDKCSTSKSTNWLSGASTAVTCCALVLERKRQHISHFLRHQRLENKYLKNIYKVERGRGLWTKNALNLRQVVYICFFVSALCEIQHWQTLNITVQSPSAAS